MRPSWRTNFQHECTVRRLVNLLNPASSQSRSQFTHHLGKFCRRQCHGLSPVGRYN